MTGAVGETYVDNRGTATINVSGQIARFETTEGTPAYIAKGTILGKLGELNKQS